MYFDIWVELDLWRFLKLQVYSTGVLITACHYVFVDQTFRYTISS